MFSFKSVTTEKFEPLIIIKTVCGSGSADQGSGKKKSGAGSMIWDPE
jgi:hypothetical protein